jgi:uncharacterized protein YecT (DUF1311 family)
MKITITVCILLVSAGFICFSEGADWRDESIRRFEEADAELEATFQNLIEDIKQKHPNDPFLNEWIDQLTISHEAWKKFRDEDQKAAGFFWRGGGTGRAQTEWETRLTLQRINDLKKYYDPR